MATSNVDDRHLALILLSGVPGTGKTTFARLLATRLGAAHIESDAIRRDLFPRPNYDSRESARVFARVEARTSEALEAHRSAVVDATNLAKDDRRRFFRAAKRSGASLVCVRLVAPDNEVRARLRRARSGHSQADVRVFELMRGKAELFSQPLVVVDSRYAVDASVELVVSLVEGGYGGGNTPEAAVR
jgi:predicted kinase